MKARVLTPSHTITIKHKVNLRKRGYSPKFINHFTDQVKFLDRSFELSKKKVIKKLQKIPFVTRFTPSASSAIKIINKYWPSLQELHQFQHTRIPRPMLCYRTNKNIRTHLVHFPLIVLFSYCPSHNSLSPGMHAHY